VVLALDFDRDERFVVNAIIHEFAHKLDMLNGDADGIPPLHADMDPRLWSRVLLTAGWRHALRLDTEAADVIDPVAAESAAEFFAVASEVFFERPRRLRRHYPRLYQQFCRFYRQDPAARYRAGFINQPKQESQDAS
jgi:Mlc titration factor MtfA (ptsG expression regulator)